MLHPGEQRLRRQHLDPRRGQLDRQRQAVQPGADLGDDERVVLCEHELGRDRPRALEEERDRVVSRKISEQVAAPGRAAPAAGRGTPVRRRYGATPGSWPAA